MINKIDTDSKKTQQDCVQIMCREDGTEDKNGKRSWKQAQACVEKTKIRTGWLLKTDPHLEGSSLGSFSPGCQWDQRWGSRSWAACTCSANILLMARSALTLWWSLSHPSGLPCGLPRHGSLFSTPEDDATQVELSRHASAGLTGVYSHNIVSKSLVTEVFALATDTVENILLRYLKSVVSEGLVCSGCSHRDDCITFMFCLKAAD